MTPLLLALLYLSVKGTWWEWPILAVTVLAVWAWYSRETPELHYNKESALWRDFVSKSGVDEMVYEPFFLTPESFTQFSWTAGLTEFKHWVLGHYFPATFRDPFCRDLFTVDDGGTMGVDWVIDPATGQSKPDGSRPILILFPGLSGSNYVYYLNEMFSKARNRYHVGIALLRGTNDLPLTSKQIMNQASWRCARDVMEWVNGKYRTMNEGRVRIYAMGFSQGAFQLGSYLTRDENADKMLDAAGLVGTCFDMTSNLGDFYANWGGWLAHILGVFKNDQMRAQLDQLKEHVTPEEFERICAVVDENTTGRILCTLNEKVHLPQVSWAKNYEEFLANTSVTGRLGKIKVPTFVLHALDDPICFAKNIPFDEIRETESVLLATTKRGTHVAHVQPFGSCWFPRPYLRFFDYMECVVHGNTAFTNQLPRVAAKLQRKVPRARTPAGVAGLNVFLQPEPILKTEAYRRAD